MEKKLSSSTEKVRFLAINAMISALYIALTFLVFPIAGGAVQFRISESLNHLIVFNKKMLWGVLGGVIIFNMMFAEFGWIDVLFGGTQTLLSLLLTASLEKRILSIKKRLVANTIIFTASMALIALMLNLFANLPFWPTYATTALGEAVVMTIAMPIMYWLNERIHFDKQL